MKARVTPRIAAGLVVAVVTASLLPMAGVSASTTPRSGPAAGGTALTVPVPGADSFLRVSTGFTHTLGIDAEGNVWAWGWNLDGQLGDNSLTPFRDIPHQSTRGTAFSRIAAGDALSVGIDIAGGLYTWGDDAEGQLGLGPVTTDARAPIRIAGLPPMADAAAGARFVVALDRDGALWGWGRNGEGQLGLGTTTSPIDRPQRVLGAPPFTAVAAGARHALAIDTNGDLWSWGQDADGQLGNGDATGVVLAPERITTGTTFVAVAAGDAHSLALDARGTVWAWGDATYGQLGFGAAVAEVDAPQRLAINEAVRSISAGALHSLALTDEGGVLAWGSDSNAQLGNGAGSIDVPTPTPLSTGPSFMALTSGPLAYFTTALDANGDVWAWGSDAFQQLGNGTVQELVHEPMRVTEDSQWADIAAGGLHTIALDADGDLWGWGNNVNGSAGTGDGVIAHGFPTRIDVGARFTAVAAAGLHSLALDDTGNVWAWGWDEFGQVGNGLPLTNVTSPVRITNGVVFTAISTGNLHSAALDVDGNIWAWGLNGSGEVGIGDPTIDVVASPVQITSGTTFASIALGDQVSTAIDADGTLWTWGSDSSARLGNGPGTSSVATPTPVTSGTRFIVADMGGAHGAALDSDGRVWTWGQGAGALLGNGVFLGPDVDVPTPIESGARFQTLSVRGTNTIALDGQGRLWGWGFDTDNQLGNGPTRLDAIEPTLSDPDLRFRQIDMGTLHAAAIGLDGKLYAWGQSEDGQVGIGRRDDEDWVTSPYRLGGTTTITAITIDGVAGTGLTRLDETTARVITPAGTPGPASIAISYTVDGAARPVVELGDVFTYLAPAPPPPDPTPEPPDPTPESPGPTPGAPDSPPGSTPNPDRGPSTPRDDPGASGGVPSADDPDDASERTDGAGGSSPEMPVDDPTDGAGDGPAANDGGLDDSLDDDGQSVAEWLWIVLLAAGAAAIVIGAVVQRRGRG